MKLSTKNIPVVILCIYFTSKMLWDGLIPYFFEILSLSFLAYGAIKFILKQGLKRKNILLSGLYIAFSIYVLFNAFIQDTASQLNRAIYEYLVYSMFLFSMAYYISRSNIFKCLKIINCWGVIIAFLSWYEYFTKTYIIGDFTGQTILYGGINAFRTAVFTRSYLSHGIVLGFFSIVSCYLFLSTKKKRYFVSILLCYLAILTTSSRGPLVSTSVALLVTYLLNQYRQSKNTDKKTITWLILMSIAIMALWFLTSSFEIGNPTLDYFLYRMRQIINWHGDAGNAGRIIIWNQAISWFKTNILFGIGPSKTGSWGSASIGVTESGVLKHLCELGMCGFSIYYIYMSNVIMRGINKYRVLNDSDKVTAILYFGIVVMVLINNIILQSTEEIMVSFIFWLGMGGLLAMCTKYQESELMRRK